MTMLHCKIVLNYKNLSETLELEEFSDLVSSTCTVKSSEIKEVTIN
jgi:hypothetical protein